MKKSILSVMVAATLACAAPDVKAENKIKTENKTTLTCEEEEQAQILVDRLNQINEIDKSSLTSFEKRGLRKEVRKINLQLRELHGGIYLSAGAIIIIILLLIILL